MIRTRILPHLLIGFLLIALSLVVFAGVADFGFVEYDDDVYVYDNPHVRGGLSLRGAQWAFTSTRSGHWHPLTWLSHMLDCELFGLNPAAHHLSNLFLHVLNVLLLFLLLHRMTGAFWRSAFVAGLFAVHPLNVEPVAWVSSRKDLLSTLFLLLALWAYLRYTERLRVHTYGLCLALFTLGVLSKSMVVTLPCLLVLLDVWPLKRLPWKRLQGRESGPSVRAWTLEKAPFFLVAGVFSIVAVIAMKGGVTEVADSAPAEYFFHWKRIANGLAMIGTHMHKTLWPHPLTAVYPVPWSFPYWKPLAAGAFLLAISWAVVRSRKGPWFLGWFWFLVTLLPFSGMINAGPVIPADRYAYVPAIGLFLLITWAGADLLERIRMGKALVGAVMAGVLLTLALTAHQGLNPWRSSETLFREAIRVFPENAKARNNLGNVLAKKGRLPDAVHQFRLALDAQPELTQAHNNLGLVLVTLGQVDAAIAHFQEALRIRPDYAEAQNNYGVALAYKGRWKEAEALYRSALLLRSDFPEAYNNLGNTMVKQGNAHAAASAFQKALALRPDYFEAHKNLGRLLSAIGQTQEGVFHLREALRLRPRQAEVHFLLACALVDAGQESEAEKHFRAVLRLEPEHARAHFKLASLLAMNGRTGEALPHFRRAVAIRPDHASSRFGLGLAYAAEGQTEKARSEAEALGRLDPRLGELLELEIAQGDSGSGTSGLE